MIEIRGTGSNLNTISMILSVKFRIDWRLVKDDIEDIDVIEFAEGMRFEH